MYALSLPTSHLQRLPILNSCQNDFIHDFEDYATQNLIAIAEATDPQKVNPEKERA